jgi:subtilisin family serine protease
MKRIFKYMMTAALFAGLAACAIDEPVINAPEHKVPAVSADTLSGELLVCFKPEVSEILDKIVATKSAPATRSGVLSVDEVLDMVEGYHIERVFPVDSRHEFRTREAGLHLWYVVRFSDKYSIEEVAKHFSQLGEVSRIEFNKTLKRASEEVVDPLTEADIKELIPQNTNANFNDKLFGAQWNLVNDGTLRDKKFVSGADVNVEKAWELTTGDPSIIVAVLDEGVDVTHPDLKANLWVNEKEIWHSHEDNDGNGYEGDVHGYNFVKQSGIVSADNKYDTGHGTHVAGVIAATNNNGEGISSIAGGNGNTPGVKIMSCQIFSGQYVGSVLDEVRAIKYAADNGAVILQCSWGYISSASNPFDWTPQYGSDEEWLMYNPLESKALDYFIHNAGSHDGVIDGGIAIFAAGNENAAAASYPGAYPDFIAVSATAGDFTPAVYSNYGPGTNIAAPGGDQDYYFEYGEGRTRGSIGCILSTVPYNVSSTGYGYMEGTSMACPHVSGVVALGLSYAAKLRKHFTADEVKELLLSTVTPIENYMTGSKTYYKYVTDLGDNQVQQINMDAYKSKMGKGQVNAYAFLKAIEGAGAPMSFPNQTVSINKSITVNPAMYFKGGESLTYTATVENSEIATVKVEGNKLVITGVKAGQTKASVKASNSETHEFVITVRKSADANGWL